jgi:rieske iron-sulfur protein
MHRRTLMRLGLAAGAAAGLAPRGLAEDDPASLRPRPGDWLVRAGDPAAMPLEARDIPPAAAPILAWPMDPAERIVRSGSRLNRLLLQRFDPELLSSETRGRAADGVVAYTAICTHTGCDTTDWLADEQLLSCPCHFSKYDPKAGAMVVDGPAPRPLPALPLKIAEGRLAVAGPFTARVGFEQA